MRGPSQPVHRAGYGGDGVALAVPRDATAVALTGRRPADCWVPRDIASRRGRAGIQLQVGMHTYHMIYMLVGYLELLRAVEEEQAYILSVYIHV